MGVYRDRIFPRIINVACNTRETQRIRELVCAPLEGELLEIGFGTGLNLPHMPDAVTHVLAVDPMKFGPRLAADRLAESPIRVDFVGTDGQSVDVSDDSVDAVISTWSLCSIADPAAAVREAVRVLRPGGRFHFAEHGASPDENVRAWQDRLNPLQVRLGCGCNLNRDIAAIIEQGGMKIDELETFYAKGDPKVLGWTFRGIASPA